MANTDLEALTARGTLLGTDILYVVDPTANLPYKVTVAELRAIDTVKVVTATQSNTTVTPAAITDLTTSLEPGTYEIKSTIIAQSTNTGTGPSFFVNCSGGTVTTCAGHVYSTTTGTTATTGVLDQATVAATFQTIESRAWRANNTDPGPFGGVDTANADQFLVLECNVVVTSTTSMQIMFRSETAGTGVSVRVGSVMKIVKAA